MQKYMYPESYVCEINLVMGLMSSRARAHVNTTVHMTHKSTYTHTVVHVILNLGQYQLGFCILDGLAPFERQEEAQSPVDNYPTL